MSPLSEYIRAAGITQAEFAATVGANQATISKLCARRKRPSLDLALRIESATKGAVPVNSWQEQSPQQAPAIGANQ